MSSRESGGQSPPPETQSGAQLKDTPGSGQGTDTFDNKEGTNKSQLEGLASNPKGVLDDAAKDKVSKTEK